MIPDKLVNFACYDENAVMVGTADATLPDLAYMTEELQGAGIAGSIDSPAVGHFQSLTTTINWRTLMEDNISFVAPKTYHFTFRGSLQMYDETTGEYVTKALKVVMKVLPKNLNLGALNVAAQMGTTATFELTYLKIDIANREYLEIDKVGFICRIDGVDYLAEVRRHLGKA